jgi:hypothetical protein
MRGKTLCVRPSRRDGGAYSVCEKRWAEILASFERQHDDLLASHPDCKEELGLIHAALITIRQLVHASPCNNGNSAVWKDLVIKAEAERAVLCKRLSGKALFTGHAAHVCYYP